MGPVEWLARKLYYHTGQEISSCQSACKVDGEEYGRKKEEERDAYLHRQKAM